MATIHSIETIVAEDDVHGGQPIIAETRVRVTDVVASHLYRGHNPDELAVNFNLDLGQVYAVLAYYYQHKAEIDALMQSEADRAEIYLDRLAQSGRISVSSELRLCFDESVELAVSEQLAVGGLDVVSAHNLDVLRDDDRNHLERATAMGRVLCTYDADFLRLTSEGVEHAGIIFAPQRKASIGRWAREIWALHARPHAEGQVIFLSVH